MTHSLSMSRFVLGSVLLCLVVLLACCDANGPSMPEQDPQAASIQLAAEPDGETVQLEWSGSNLESAVSYRLFRADHAGFDTTGTFYVGVTATTYTDRDVEPVRVYHYRVAAIDGTTGKTLALSSSDEAQPEDRTPPPPPSNLAGAGGFYTATLTWNTVSSEDLAGYHVYRGPQSFMGAEDAERLTAAPLDTTGFEDTSVMDGERYVYRVSSVDRSGNESELSAEISVTPAFSGDAVRGRQLFADNCAVCHVNFDAWDLAAFAMPDTMIHRRALAHVTEQEAFDIIRFVHSTDVPVVDDAVRGKRELPSFQPGGRILASDLDFATELFGEDSWPEDLTEEELLQINPIDVPIPLELPVWSDQQSALDWLPDQPLPERLRGGAVDEARIVYSFSRSDRRMSRLVRIMERELTKAERWPGDEHGGNSLNGIEHSFNLHRWMSVVIGQHVIRHRYSADEIARRFAEGEDHLLITWWKTGDVARRSQEAVDPAVPLARPYKKAAKWFYLAWMFSPAESPQFQEHRLARALDLGYGLKRMAAFATAYGTAKLGDGTSLHMYENIEGITYAPDHWKPVLLPFILNSIWRNNQNGVVEKSAVDDALDALHHYTEDVIQGAADQFMESDRQAVADWVDRIESQLATQL